MRLKTRPLFLACLPVLGGLAAAFILLLVLSGHPLVARAEPDVRYVSPSTCGEMAPCYSRLYMALEAANNGDEIRVAAGWHNWRRPRDIGGDVYTQVAYINKDLALIGGYTPFNWTSPDPVANQTILDAMDLGRVVFIDGAANVSLSGFHIRNGNAQEGDPRDFSQYGGGIYAPGVDLTISDCEIYDNESDFPGMGGGIYIVNGNLTMADTVVRDNWVDGGGGGVMLANSSATIDRSTFLRNEGLWGAAIRIDGADGILRNNVIYDNRSHYQGGAGLCVSDGSQTQLLHNTFYNNYGGDDLDTNDSAIQMNDNGTTVAMTNNIIMDQTKGIVTVDAGCTVNAIANFWGPSGSVVVKYHGSGSHNNTKDYGGVPHFVSIVSRDFHLTQLSQAIGKGEQTGVLVDKDGRARPLTGADLGAYQHSSAGDVDSGGGTLTFTDTQDTIPLTTTIEVPPGAVSETITLVYTEIPSSTHNPPSGFSFAGRYFTVYAVKGGEVISDFTFLVPGTKFTLYYNPALLGPLTPEGTLGLQYWDGPSGAWSSSGISIIKRDSVHHYVVAAVDHLSEFAMLSPETVYVYLPLVLKE